MHISNADHMIGFKTKCSVIIVPPPLPTATLNFSLQGERKLCFLEEERKLTQTILTNKSAITTFNLFFNTYLRYNITGWPPEPFSRICFLMSLLGSSHRVTSGAGPAASTHPPSQNTSPKNSRSLSSRCWNG